MPRRLALLIEYDGTNYSGWQRQPNGRTIQEVFEAAVKQMTGEHCDVVASGRTDKGVHGFGQVAHVVIPDSCTIPLEKMVKALHSPFVPDVQVRAVSLVPDNFHARFSAICREYRYTIARTHSVFRHRYAWRPRFRFNPELLQAAADVMVGIHDFTTFSKLNLDTDLYMCAVESAVWRKVSDDIWEFRIRANRYVYGMVRSLVGSMMDVAAGNRSAEDLRTALVARDRLLNSTLAPACGLVLWRVEYVNDPFAAYFGGEEPTSVHLFPSHQQ